MALLPGPQHRSRTRADSFWAHEVVKPPAQLWGLTTGPGHYPVPKQPSRILSPYHRCVSPTPNLPSALLPVRGREAPSAASTQQAAPLRGRPVPVCRYFTQTISKVLHKFTALSPRQSSRQSFSPQPQLKLSSGRVTLPALAPRDH